MRGFARIFMYVFQGLSVSRRYVCFAGNRLPSSFNGKNTASLPETFIWHSPCQIALSVNSIFIPQLKIFAGQ
jgi:hypothetical protein